MVVRLSALEVVEHRMETSRLFATPKSDQVRFESRSINTPALCNRTSVNLFSIVVYSGTKTSHNARA